MHASSSLLVSLFIVVASGLPAIPAAIGSATTNRLNYGKPFTTGTIILGTGSDTYHAHPLSAKNGIFTLDGKNGSRCPPGATGCPHKDETGLIISSDGSAKMNTVVPGRQQLYIAKDGSLSYTKPGASPPDGSLTKGFTPRLSLAQNLLSGGYHWMFVKDSADPLASTGLYACSNRERDPKSVYADVPGFEKSSYSSCDTISPMMTFLDDGSPSAYEYQ